MQNSIIPKIKSIYDLLSKQHRALADYIIENSDKVIYLSINELSKLANVSPATITRFSRVLGFTGYPDFQRCLREDQQQLTPFRQLKSLLQDSSMAGSSSHKLHSTLISNIALLEQLYTPELQLSFSKALDILHNAHGIYIAGQRSSYTSAYYLAFMLQQMRDHVHLLSTSSGMLPFELSSVKEDDVLIMISYARYTTISDNIVSHFHSLGNPIILISDSMTSPLAIKASEVLIAPNGDNFSPVCAISLCNCIITALGSENPAYTLSRMERQDKIALANNIYI